MDKVNHVTTLLRRRELAAALMLASGKRPPRVTDGWWCGSVPVEKAVGSTDEPAADQLAAGTIVVRGRGVATVTATGPNSSIGRLAALLDTGPQITPLQRRLSSLSRILALIAAILCISVAVIGLLRGEPLQLMAVTAISLAVATVPESLPAVITLSLAIGARRMAARHAIVRRLPAVETLGSVSVIATDKTGTITEGRMVVQQVWTPVGEAAIGGTGYRLDGDIVRNGRVVRAEDAPDLAALLRAAALCTDATVHFPDSAQPQGQNTGRSNGGRVNRRRREAGRPSRSAS